MLSFARPGCSVSVGLVTQSSPSSSSWILLTLFLPQVPVLDLSWITGQDLFEVAGAKKSTAGGLDGWAWNEVKALPPAWFSGLAELLRDVSGDGRPWSVEMDVHDLGGHQDFTKRARADTLSRRVKDAAHGVAEVGTLPLRFQAKLGLARETCLPAGLQAF